MKNGIGERIREGRKRINKTQKELAIHMKVSPQVISNWEREYTYPDPDDIVVLSNILGCSTHFIITGEEETIPTSSTNEKHYDSLNEISRHVKQLGINDMGFFDIEKWKNLSPEDVEMIKRHFDMVVELAEKRRK